jgi:hypothetical protein
LPNDSVNYSGWPNLYPNPELESRP